ncbi:ABC transporter ATP-binding protein [Streptococcus caprae]|uniref:ABC transporter ATP-binding protein n=1 Tax=Streptococcus caprae TaxID=1640501 RepID=A0ABV8CTT5_9STRE
MAVFKQLLQEIRLVKGKFALGLIILILATAGNQLAPLSLQTLIDGPLTYLSTGDKGPMAILLEGLAGYLSLIIGAGILSYVARLILMACANTIAGELRNRAYAVMQSLPISYFDDKPAGKISTRIVNDTETLRSQFYGTLLSQIFISVLQVLFIYGVLFSLEWRFGLALLLLLPLFYGWQVLYHKLTQKPTKAFYEARSDLNSLVNETMNGASILQLYGQEEVVWSEFEETAGTMRAADERLVLIGATVSWSLAELFKYLIIAGVLTLVGYQFLAGHTGITAGRLFVYLNYMVTLFDLMAALVRQFPALQRTKETGQRVLELLAAQGEPDVSADLPPIQGQVVFDQVSFGYMAEQAVLSDINFQIEQGQTLALVGHTGSGKSSITNLLYRFYEPGSGQILIDGLDISQFSRESLRSQMGIVLQDPYLFTGTIASNVSMGQAYSDQAIQEALEQVGAGDMLARLSKGIHEPVVEKGAAFSSGERQLIAFARTLIADPKILILDEATSHIDTETEEIIQRAMEVVQAGRTTIIIAHRLSTIQEADQILVLDKGRIVEQGNHQELMALGGQYAHMQALQQKVDAS